MADPLHVVMVPPSTSLVNAWKNTHVPVGVLLLARLIEQAGMRCSLWDGALCFPDADAADRAAGALLARGVQVVGFSAWCHTLPAQLSLAEAIKRVDPRVVVVFGGPQATATDVALLQASPAIDHVLRGEAEQSFVALLCALRDGTAPDTVPGLTVRRGAEVVRTPAPTPVADLDALPLPAHHLAPDSAVATVESGRGCPWTCTFCSTSAFFARKHRARGAASLVDELHVLAARGVRHVTFTDDIFTVNKRQTLALCDELDRRPPGLAWGCSTRIDCVTPELLGRMAAAGCDGILFGVETGSARMQKVMGKRLDVQRVLPTVQATRQAGIRPYCTFIFGFPESTPSDFKQTTDLVRVLVPMGVHVTAQTLAVLPDTPYHHTHRDQLRFDGFSSLSRAALSPSEMTRVAADPLLFSSFHYLESGAASRRALIGAASLTNLLRHFRHTARLAGFDDRVDPFALLLAQPPDDSALAAGFDRYGMRLIGSLARGPAAEAFAVEAAALELRLARMADPVGPTAFEHRARHALEPLLDETGAPAGAAPSGAARYRVQLWGETEVRIERL